MAKDGTLRGGARPGSGPKKKALSDKILEGNPGGRKLEIMEFKNASKLVGNEMPEPSDLLSAEQKDGSKLAAVKIHKDAWEWLSKRGCAELISPQLLERYAVSLARWVQCQEAINKYGFLAKHPTTGNAMQSPYEAIGQSYLTQANRLWLEIFQIVKENCTSEYKGSNPQEDVMEQLLNLR